MEDLGRGLTSHLGLHPLLLLTKFHAKDMLVFNPLEVADFPHIDAIAVLATGFAI